MTKTPTVFDSTVFDRQHSQQVTISPKSHRLLKQLLDENPALNQLLSQADDQAAFERELRKTALTQLDKSPQAKAYFHFKAKGKAALDKLSWQDYATIRILDYLEHSGRELEDLNLRGKKITNQPFGILWKAYKYGTGGAKPAFFDDMIMLFRQFYAKCEREMPTNEQIGQWMDRHPSGLDPDIVEMRKNNKERILKIIIEQIDQGTIKSSSFQFEDNTSAEQKYQQALEWWSDRKFHLKFAVRSPELLNQMLNYSLPPETLQIMAEAKAAGIPFFVNPYYLSLLNVHTPDFAIGADLAIRQYVLYSRQLVEEFGHIVAWEKEDIVKPGQPNAAGWILPSHHSVHRRYPEVAILIPETVGRACGGLCASCQRMYDFQSGHLNFDLDKLKPNETWKDRLQRYMQYFENDTQLRDILITGGDALMSSDRSLEHVLDAVYQMAVRKKQANKKRPKGEKYAEMLRVRLGTRLPVYLPQRMTPELQRILKDFKEKASKIGVKQFVIQTHFESAMEITPEARKGIKRLISAGWTVTNQLVFTAAASRRGHTAKLRKVLNEVGVLTYYTFTVKGYMENNHNFAPSARSVQEQTEEKHIGEIPEQEYNTIRDFPLKAENMVENIDALRRKHSLPFLATDRNVLNLPGVGKSITFRVIGITQQGRRILEFDHDATRRHSPIIHKMGKVVIIESKSISEFISQMDEMGEDITEYQNLYGYSIGETEVRIPVYEYPGYDFEITDQMSNLEV